jgi:vacuolar-type H+-ATPase subunit C/Vma6
LFDTRYPFISAYLKGEEAKTITSDHINRMSMASNIQDALGAIRQTDIGSYFEELHARNFDVLDEHLWRYFVQRINYIGSFKLLPGDVLKYR